MTTLRSMLPAALMCTLGPAASPVWAQEPVPARVYVAEVSAAAGVDVDPQGLILLGDTLRGTAANMLPARRYRVITREEVEAFQEEAGAAMCLGGECVTQDAEKLQADFAVEAQLLKLAGVYNLNIKLHSVKDKVLLGQVEAQNADVLVLREAAKERMEFVLRHKLMRLTGGLEGVTVEVPVLDLTANTPTFNEFDPEVEERFEAAMKIHGAKDVAPEVKQTAWCRLAEIKQSNRHLETAERSCEGWSAYVSNLHRLRDSIAKDYDKVSRLVKLSTLTTDQKLGLMDEFVEIYSIFQADRRLVNVKDARRLVERDGTTILPAYVPAQAASSGGTRRYANVRSAPSESGGTGKKNAAKSSLPFPLPSPFVLGAFLLVPLLLPVVLVGVAGAAVVAYLAYTSGFSLPTLGVAGGTLGTVLLILLIAGLAVGAGVAFYLLVIKRK